MSYTPTFAGFAGAAGKGVFVTFDGTRPSSFPTFTKSAVSGNVITTALNHGFTLGEPIAVTFAGSALPAPLQPGIRYWIVATGVKTLKVYATKEAAAAQTGEVSLATGTGTVANSICKVPPVLSSHRVDYVWFTETTHVFGIAFTPGTWANPNYAMSGSSKFDADSGCAVPIAGFYRSGPLPTVNTCVVNLISTGGTAYSLSRMGFMFIGDRA